MPPHVAAREPEKRPHPIDLLEARLPQPGEPAVALPDEGVDAPEQAQQRPAPNHLERHVPHVPLKLPPVILGLANNQSDARRVFQPFFAPGPRPKVIPLTAKPRLSA